ncbi:hypothetical protein [Thiorhodococcus minor]|uniref:Uncharacterized protein n=1 Tax=Thiorhodococcus minor TaxID=57489 RepID=A0A6M0K6K5_9GAMM|nr:hypothetical protein [Thiorhodococcus minor]NEV65382.1 hypothetical protein [Thiorhodococcus minor]
MVDELSAKAFEAYVSELKGYLKAFDRVCGRSYFFGVICLETKESLDIEMQSYFNRWNKERDKKILYKGFRVIDYNALVSEIDEMVFHGFLNVREVSGKPSSGLSGVFVDDINEFFGLISTTINPEGVFYPLRKSPIYLLEISREDLERALFFSVKVEHVLLITYFYKVRVDPSACV